VELKAASSTACISTGVLDRMTGRASIHLVTKDWGLLIFDGACDTPRRRF
jgi:hypothetical protein